ncbi:hypothetical protein CCR75_003778 [Bremia lactucae]|uniref:UDP-glucose:glycoprotein glucosyltransferase n=1 Tax=Bremia lactucae TaxID=4779 RepID=A0A976IKN2_BRELC|nr:hypothetical protein CCR75_003778 [Bremia lactucae]
MRRQVHNRGPHATGAHLPLGRHLTVRIRIAHDKTAEQEHGIDSLQMVLYLKQIHVEHQSSFRKTMRRSTWLGTVLAALLAAVPPLMVYARGVHVKLKASWPTSPFFPLMETSEFLADENPLYFWQFLEQLEERTSYVELMSSDVDALAELAVVVAEFVAPGLQNVLELMLATRTYSVKVEMFRQLGLDSGVRPCGVYADTWAVFYREPHCVEAVACSVVDLDDSLRNMKQKISKKTCIAAGFNDIELRVDHKYPCVASTNEEITPMTAILYGLVGTTSFHAFHSTLVNEAKQSKIQYIVRHYPRDSPLETLLQGYGVALDIKNMEYKTIDDSRMAGGDETAANGENEVDEDEDKDIDDEEVSGFLFKPLLARHVAIAFKLKQFHDMLVKKSEQDQELRAWHLKDLGASAVRAIVDAKNSLKRLETLSQDFPIQAKRLAFSQKLISTELREEIASTRMQASMRGLTNKFIMNGIAIDPTERSFNVFDFMKTLKTEWSVAKQLASLTLNQTELEDMLTHVRETNQEQPIVRIHVRGSMDGTTPLYLNNIETDANSADWPSDINVLKRPAWSLIFLRKNMYECVLVMDPLTGTGRAALSHVEFLQARNAPIQWALLISSKELIASNTFDERQALVEKYKTLKGTDKANPWHFTKLLMLAQAKEKCSKVTIDGEKKQAKGGDDDTSNEKEKVDQVRSMKIVSGFLQRVGNDDSSIILIDRLVEAYAEAAAEIGSPEENEDEAMACLSSDQFDEEVLSMTEFIILKHLPLNSFIFNGVIQKDLDIQGAIMANFGRDQPLYINMAYRDMLNNEMDLIEQLLMEQNAYFAYLSIFESSRDRLGDKEVDLPNHLVADDVDGRLKAAAQQAISYLHPRGSRNLPKKQTVIFPVYLNDPRDADHAYRVVKAVLEDSDKSLRVGIVPQISSDVKSEGVGELLAAILAITGDSDNEVYLKFVLEALTCIVKKKSVEASRGKLKEIWKGTADSRDENDSIYIKVLTLLSQKPGKWLSTKQRGVLTRFNALLRSRFPSTFTDESLSKSALPYIFVNGRQVDLPRHSLSDEDVATILSFDLKHRSQPVAKALIKRSATLNAKEADKLSFSIMKTTGIVDKYVKIDRTSRMEVNENSLNTVRLDGDPSLQVTAYVDPLSEAAQVMSSLLCMLHSQLNASIELVLIPANEYASFPLQRFYRYLFDKKLSLAETSVEFRKLPVQPILTMKIDTPEAWNVQTFLAGDDLDNLRVDPESLAAVRSTTRAVFQLESLLVYGQCSDITFNMYSPPNGLQLVLEREVGAQLLHRDTLVMQNLGYFQLQATPGVWSLHLAEGRAAKLFDIINSDTELRLEARPITVFDFGSHMHQFLVRKKAGMEHEVLLQSIEDAVSEDTTKTDSNTLSSSHGEGALRSYWNSLLNVMGKNDDNLDTISQAAVKEVNETSAVHQNSTSLPQKRRTGETIHVFSVASGYLYERFVKIMMSSVLKRTNNPVTFWLLENFLSPDFKKSIPILREQLGMDIRLVTYKWPNWLRQQTEKQRIIWGYKILFLDVLFPLGVQKIIYVDADQVVRADLKELWELDLEGKPYGYTPFCNSRNIGFQFWRQGFWKDHLRGKPYHISALYVVDLALFRQMAAGDMLRAVYSQLSADPNSLANLDQDLPNYVQNQIPIFSLPQEWLWCESWCSDETKATAKTIDLCNNPQHKEPKLDMAKRIINGELFDESWTELDQEIKDAEGKHA